MKQEVKTAAWVAASGFLWVVLEFITGLHGSRIALHGAVTWLAFIPAIMIYIWHYRSLKKQQPQLTFKKGFISGLIVTGVSIPFSQLGFMLFYYLINPNFFSAFTKYTVDNKIMSAEVAAQYFNLGNYLLQIAVGLLFIGIILSAVLSLIFKTKSK